jgi:hypothetical protein
LSRSVFLACRVNVWKCGCGAPYHNLESGDFHNLESGDFHNLDNPDNLW